MAFDAARAIIEELAAKLQEEAMRDDFLRHGMADIPRLPPPPRRSAKHAFGGLTEREREVTGLIAQHKSNRAIADRLVLSERTVEKHVENILSKLGFVSREQVIAWAAEHGLINMPSRSGRYVLSHVRIYVSLPHKPAYLSPIPTPHESVSELERSITHVRQRHQHVESKEELLMSNPNSIRPSFAVFWRTTRQRL